ncbi:arylformamidase [Lewinella marina]|uniref:Kynurenine formamidase n=1 Tax=Neolewinella marina TaxID=438751 RepID=A0A2G0CFB9_9BACT|nr:cyclase family protein [Neolewinella marina]NJB85701.1 arylformamidase [Neolewinella marina]PHK98620.1 arylformamidase [Neolewinella marina]
MAEWYEGWTDVTYPIFEGITGWPGQPTTHLETLSCIHCGDTAKVSVLHMSVHTGTHMDAPCHFLAQGIDVSRFPIEVGMGPVRVAEIDCPAEVRPEDLEAYEGRSRPLVSGERLILRTGNSDAAFWPQAPFDEDYHGIGPAAAAWIAKRKLQLVGVDYLSVGPFHSGNPQTHRALLGAGVWVIEGVDLRHIREGNYEMICLPLKIAGSDGSPIRILLRPANN